MQRVAIVGCGGSGKSHLARELGRIVDAPVTHLDSVYYDDGWNPLSSESSRRSSETWCAASAG